MHARSSDRFQFFVLLILFQQLLTVGRVHGNSSSCRQLLKSNDTESSGLSTDAVPREMKVPVGNKLKLCYFAEGFQKYRFNGTAWNNFNASAVLSENNRTIGQHFFLPKMDKFGGQPTWETFSPWSIVTSKVLVKLSVTKDAIPWVLLQSTQESGSPKRFGKVTYNQRLFTTGGLPPDSTSAVCGQYFESPYTAVYAFYVKH